MKAALHTPLTPVPHICLGHLLWAIVREHAPSLRSLLIASGRQATLDQVRVAKELLHDALPCAGPHEAFCGDIDLSLELWRGFTLAELLWAIVEIGSWNTLMGGAATRDVFVAQTVVRGLGAFLTGLVG